MVVRRKLPFIKPISFITIRIKQVKETEHSNSYLSSIIILHLISKVIVPDIFPAIKKSITRSF